MPSDLARLRDLQMQVGRAVLAAEEASAAICLGAIENDGLAPGARLAIYRNHANATFEEALAVTFPVVCRLVDRHFFAFAAHHYRRAFPPRSRRLADYGADFPGFLADFEPARDHPYLADMARFEWALGRAGAAPQKPAIAGAALAGIAAAAAPGLVFRLQPSLHHVLSDWPIGAIWQANQSDAVPPVTLTDGPARLEIRRHGDSPSWRSLEPGYFAFCAALANGMTLAAAIAQALSAEPHLDPTAALKRVVGEGLVTGYALAGGEVPQ
jgi:hypothetical protein